MDRGGLSGVPAAPQLPWRSSKSEPTSGGARAGLATWRRKGESAFWRADTAVSTTGEDFDIIFNGSGLWRAREPA